jgi:hypothetical protein
MVGIGGKGSVFETMRDEVVRLMGRLIGEIQHPRPWSRTVDLRVFGIVTNLAPAQVRSLSLRTLTNLRCDFIEVSCIIHSSAPCCNLCLNLVTKRMKLAVRFRRDKRKRAPPEEKRYVELSLCLARACLGKMIVLMYKWLKKTVSTHQRPDI